MSATRSGAFLAAADSGRPGTWNIGTGTEVSVLELARVIGQVAGHELDPVFAPARPGELLRGALAAERARRDLGWAPDDVAGRRHRPGVPVDRGRARRSGPAGSTRLAAMSRPDGRQPDQLREVKITRGWLDHAEGSVLVEFGATRVLCAASVQEDLPRWRRGSGQGWVTAEYAMLPRSTNTRSDRESVKGRIGGRTHEISRLVGRSLRACIDPKALGREHDRHRLRRPAGRRRHPDRGDHRRLRRAGRRDRLAEGAQAHQGRAADRHRSPRSASASSTAQPRLDLCYDEDVAAETDMNVVCTGDGSFVEVQGTAEREPFDRALLDELLDLAVAGCAELTKIQQAALGA